MTLLLSIFLTDILPVFVIAGAGFLLARLVGASVKTMSHAVFYVAMPCLVFRLIVSSAGIGEVLGRMVLLAVMMTLTMGVVGVIVAKVLGLDRVGRRAFLLVVMFSNVGNYGLPVVSFAFGAGALTYATVFFLTGSVLTYTLGTFIAAGARASVAGALGKVFRMPSLYGVMLALVVVITGMSVPVPIMRPVTLLSEAALPMMILVLGMQLERAQSPKRPVVVGSAVAVSLVAAPFIAAVLTYVLGITGPARQAAITLSSMPVAVVTTIVALEFDVDPDFVTSAVFVSTLVSPLTLTLVLAYLR